MPHLRPTAPAAALTVLAALLLGGCAGDDAATYPSRSAFIVCPWAAGGGTDNVSRFLARLLSDETGQSFSVINRTGGGGVTGHEAGARAEPDGYTILTITVEIAMMRHRGLTKISYKDYEPVMMINRDAAALFVRADSPWKTFDDLRRDAAASPGELRGSGTALGGIWHLGLTGVLMAAGLAPDAIRWVPSEGANPALQELVADNLHVACCSLPEASALLNSKQIRCLGVMADERVGRFPDVPTMKEQGVDWTLGGWRGIALPGGTPRRVVERLESILSRIVSGERFLTYMTQQGFDVAIQGPEEFRQTMAADDEKFKRLLRESLGSEIDIPGPWFFPALLLGGLVIIGLALAMHGVPASGQARIAEVLGAVVFYFLLADSLGFLITASAVALYLLKRLGNTWALSVAVTVLVVPSTYALFGKLMKVPLPMGPIPW